MQILEEPEEILKSDAPKIKGHVQFFKNVWSYISIIFAGALYSVALKYFIFPAKMNGTE